MNLLELTDRLTVRTGETNSSLLEDLLESAKNAILARRYPYGDGSEKLEPKYEDLQIRIAEAMLAKLGAEYQTGHSENGISRSWKSEGIPEALLAEITPMCGGFR